jgi:CDP-diacylglycerol--glycerol-3-phosphate 3-phosphatidyltransferase
MNIPNALTLLRMVLIPIFVVLFYFPEFETKHIVLTTIFVIAGISDWFDGFLARRLKQQSAFGAFLDPVADKLMVGTVLALLISKHPGPLLAVPGAVIIGREIAISALREWMANIGEHTKVAVSFIGKVKTTAQMVALGMLIYEVDAGPFPTLIVGYVLLYLAAGLTLWSMVMYLKAAWPSLMGAPPGGSASS